VIALATPEERERNEQSRRRHERMRQAQWDASVCAICGDHFGPRAVVWLGPVQYTTKLIIRHIVTCAAPLCANCRHHYSCHYHPEVPCAGCGRPVCRWVTRRRCPRHVVCSQACRRKCHRQEAEVRKVERRRVCAVCGQEFLPPRCDARTCSSACRQKAYRRRVTATKTSAIAIPTRNAPERQL
jgi:hypothetical protein